MLTHCKLVTSVLLALLAAASAGCIVQRDGQPLGAAALDAVTQAVRVSPGARGCGGCCHGTCCGAAVCEDYSVDEFQGGDDWPAAAASGSDSDYDSHYDSDYDHYAPPHEADGLSASGPACGAIAEESGLLAPPPPVAVAGSAVFLPLYSVAMLPREAVTGAVHFCIAPAAFPPPEPPPPSRFLPVPARPAFAPRLEPLLPRYSGY